MPDGQLAHPIYWPISKLCAAYACGELAPMAVLNDVFERLSAFNPRLNAFLSVLEPLAREQALAAQEAYRNGTAGPLAGIPISIKDTFDVAGVVTTRGSLVGAAVARADSGAVRRLRAAGALFVGKTNTAEFGQSATTDNRLGEDCRNPWDLSRTPGGSSGGAAVSVAAGIVMAALGADGGGSIRIPAAFTGLVGVKPTMEICPDEGGFAAMSDFCCPGPLCWRVADTRIVLSVLSGLPFAKRPIDRPLRVAWCPNPQSLPVDPDVAAAVADCARLLAAAGHRVEEVDLALDGWNDAFAPLVIEEEGRLRGNLLATHRNQLTTYERRTLEAAASQNIEAVARARQQLRDYRLRFDAFFADHDVILTPATAVTAFALRQRPSVIAGRPVDALWGAFPFTAPFNVAGTPAASLPCGLAEGRPVGVQLVCARGADQLLLDVAEYLEGAIGFDAAPVIAKFASPRSLEVVR